MTTKKYRQGTHPNSLAALTNSWDSDKAREAQLLGAKARSANAARRNALKQTMKDLKAMKEDLFDGEQVGPVDLLTLLMNKAYHEEDFDTAADLAAKLAEFERPKLARKEVKVEETKTDDMSDEELEARIKAALGDDE